MQGVLECLAGLHERGLAVAGLDATCVQVSASKRENGSRSWCATLTDLDRLTHFTPGAILRCESD